MGSKGSQQTTQSYTPNSNVGQSGSQALNMAQGAANLPFQQQVAPVAGFSDDQLSAFANMRAHQGYAEPYIQGGAQLLNQSAQPISAAQVGNYLNPYADYVLANMRDSAGQQMAQTTGRLTQAAGGVGADRIGVAQANLAKQQQLAEGQTLAGIYGSALGAAQQDASRQQSAAFGLGQLGTAGQAAAMQGDQTLYNAGSLQQQQQQAELNAPYQWDLARIAHNYQIPQWLSQVTAQTAPSLGGTTTNTYPAPSPWGTIAGLGMTALGAFTGNPGMMGSGLKGTMGGQQSMGMMNGNYGLGGWNPNVSGGWIQPGAFRASGGRVTPMDVFKTFAGGGMAYADGGDVPTFDDRFSAISDNPRIAAAMENGDPLPDEASVLSPPPPQLPPQITNPDSLPMGETQMGYAGAPPPRMAPAGMPGGMPPPPVPEEQPLDGEIMPPEQTTPFQEWSRGPGFALMQAGLGTLAAAGKRDSRGLPLSPWAAIGEGGMKGIQTVQKQDTAANQRRRVELEAKRLLNQAQHQRNTLAETRRYHDIIDQNRRDQLDITRQTLNERNRHNIEIERRAGDPAMRSPEQQALIAATQKKGSPLTDDEIVDVIGRLNATKRTNAERTLSPVQQAIQAEERRLGRKLTADEIIKLNNGVRTGPGAEIPEDPGEPSTIMGTDRVVPNFKGALGGGGAYTRGANAFTGFLGSQAYPQEAAANRILEDLAVRTQQTLNGVAGRPSNYWLQRIQTLTVDPKKYTEGPQAAESRLKQTRATIQTEIDRTEAMLRSPNTSKADRSKATRSLMELRSLKSDYEAVLDNWSAGGNNPLTPLGAGVGQSLPKAGAIQRGAARAASELPGGGRTPPRPANVPPGSRYSASRKAWRTPDGTIIPHTDNP